MIRSKDSKDRGGVRWMAAILAVLGGAVLIAGCAGAGGGAGCRTSLPAGSYAGVCESCTMEGTVVSCECEDGLGHLVSSQLDTCDCPTAAASNSLGDDHGQLKCGSPY